MFNFTPLLGSLSGELASQSLLTFEGGINILVGIGWDESCTVAKLELLRKHVSSIDLVLLTHPTIPHIGAYAYACKNLPGFGSIPVYATLPVISMGRTALIDLYRNNTAPTIRHEFASSAISTGDIESYFDKVQSLKYSQSVSLIGRLNGVSITAYNAGHTVGGTIWRIQKDQESIVCAVDWNHSRDRHLNGASLLQSNGNVVEALHRPSALICSARNSTSTLASSKKREDALTRSILATLNSGGTVLLPTDSSARILELAHLLENHWQKAKLPFPLFLISRTSKRTMQYARSMLEWMSSSIITEFEGSDHPFEFRHIKLLQSIGQLPDIGASPKVIIASGVDLEVGLSRDVFCEICTDPKNLVVFSKRPEEGSLARELLDIWGQRVPEGDIREEAAVDLYRVMTIKKTVPLEGGELQEYKQEQRLQKQIADQRLAMEMKSKNILEEDESESSDDEDEGTAHGLFASRSGKIDLGVSILLAGDTYDYDVSNAKGRNRMFPFASKRRRFDEYGEIIKAEDYMRAEEREEAEDLVSSKVLKATGEKRRWDEVALQTNRRKGEQDIEREEDVPSKVVSELRDIHIGCKFRFIDFEGLHDSRSLRMIVPQIQPRKIILNHASEMETTALAESFDEIPSVTSDIFYPPSNTTVNASVETNAYNIRIAPALADILRWQDLSTQHTVTHVSGRLHVTEMGEYSLALETQRPTKRPTLYIGDIRLAELKRTLNDSNHAAEFRGEGVLLCDGCVAIRKDGSGRVILEGLVGNEFYNVRETVYNSLAAV